MQKKISYSRQTIVKEDISSVTKVLKSDFITRGPVNEKFEKRIKDYVGSKYCLTTNSATSALHLVFHMLKNPQSDSSYVQISDADDVLTTPLTCTATNWCCSNPESRRS